jgi:CrcB protein
MPIAPAPRVPRRARVSSAHGVRCTRVETFKGFLVVCAGGALGSGSRFLVAVAASKQEWFGKDYPHGTWIVNIVGCFLIALIIGIANATAMPQNLRLFLTTGFLGGLTTYSTFNYEATRLFQEGSHALGAAYVAATTLGCCAVGLLGLATAKLVVSS